MLCTMFTTVEMGCYKKHTKGYTKALNFISYDLIYKITCQFDCCCCMEVSLSLYKCLKSFGEQNVMVDKTSSET